MVKHHLAGIAKCLGSDSGVFAEVCHRFARIFNRLDDRFGDWQGFGARLKADKIRHFIPKERLENRLGKRGYPGQSFGIRGRDCEMGFRDRVPADFR